MAMAWHGRVPLVVLRLGRSKYVLRVKKAWLPSRSASKMRAAGVIKAVGQGRSIVTKPTNVPRL
jgi:hypothetical protein